MKRSSARGVAFALIASAVAGSAVVGALDLTLRALEARALEVEDAARVEIVELPVLSRTLGAGSVVRREDVAIVPLPAELVPTDAVVALDRLVGRTVVVRVLAHEPVRPDRLAPVGAAGGLAALIPQASRAMGLDLRDDERVSGFLEPGDRVDVIVTLPPDVPGGHPRETVTLAEAVPVLAVDEELSETARGEIVRRPHVTVAVAPLDAERIAAIPADRASVKLTLRADVEVATPGPVPVVTADLLGRASRRLSVAEFRERVSDADVVRWVELVHGAHVGREPVASTSELRDPVTGDFAAVTAP